MPPTIRRRPHRRHSDFVFVNPGTGKPWNTVRKMFLRACKAAKLEGVWFHDLRHSFITNARRAGVPESVVMRMSGHRTHCVFDRYNIIEEEDLREAVQLIETTQCVRQKIVKVSKTASMIGRGAVRSSSKKAEPSNC